ncbi:MULTISPECIES: adenylate/guanylate cyclase domain-containing protein [unclassified Rhodococcus (in: high G+C Gram-positive bacteria)]|uniref:adenylate/guanylate cyclase domain-containing protein n=1 Tax=unclassified Rhodococcus (in: high G+C Gram-positive bacteria) TaxID=192944 RepID=UPI002899DDA5|nr:MULTISPECIES: adenylate/guanylate cyclase domain-containing protein [unclassified Rhodococcus (in: high G+C Gram-positive bacteria)]
MDGLDGTERSIRIRILQHLADRGISTDGLASATREGQLGHQLLDVTLSPHGAMYSLEQISQSTNISPEDVERWFRSMGRGVSTSTSVDYNDDDLRLAQLLTEYRALGIADAGLFAFARIVGRNTSTLADASKSLIQKNLDTNRDRPEIALQFARELQRFAEFQSQLLHRAVATRLRQQISQQIRADITAEHAPEAQDIAVCFADMVGFTVLGEQLTPTELGDLADRLDTLTTDLIEPPVQFVKTVGDAVMLLSPDPTRLAAVVLKIVTAAQQHGLPPIHAGIAWGTAVRSAGDWIGQPLNRASRIATIAEPREVLADSETMRRIKSAEMTIESAGTHQLKGFTGGNQLYRILLKQQKGDQSPMQDR